MPVMMFIPSLSFAAGKEKTVECILRYGFPNDLFPIQSSDKPKRTCDKHGDVLRLRDLHYARRHPGSCVDGCKAT